MGDVSVLPLSPESRLPRSVHAARNERKFPKVLACGWSLPAKYKQVLETEGGFWVWRGCEKDTVVVQSQEAPIS